MGSRLGHVESELGAHIRNIRRDLHRHPELSWQEFRTAEQVCLELKRLRISFRDGVAGTGVVAEIPGVAAGPLVALRADLDALPIQEETGLPFTSEHAGVMHACGHDGHTAMLLGAAALLCATPPPGPVRLIFQPAEETGDGAPRMIAQGVLDGVRLIFGGHVDRHYQPGQIAVTPGAVNASTDEFEVRILARGGHAARPHESVDPVVVGSLLVMSIQTIVSREVNPAHPSVVTVGSFHAGTAANVIASTAVLQGTIRAQEASVRKHLKDSIRRVAQSVGQLHDCQIIVELREGTPPVVNHPAALALARQAAAAVVGEQEVVEMPHANMGGEDFGFYLDHIPGCYVRFGSQVEGKEGFPAHCSRFDFDERSLCVGAAYYDQVARNAASWLLHEHQPAGEPHPPEVSS